MTPMDDELDRFFGAEPVPEMIEVVCISNRGELVPVDGTDYVVPEESWFAARGGELPYDVVLGLAYDGHTRRLAEVRFRQQPRASQAVTASGIRKIQLEDLKRRALKSVPMRYMRDGQEGVGQPSGKSADSFRMSEARAAESMNRRTSDDDLRLVAETYRAAVANGENPTEAVEQRMRLNNRNQAKKWVKRARAAGFLAPAPGERQGGIAK